MFIATFWFSRDDWNPDAGRSLDDFLRFFELDAIGDEIESPFGLQPNDLALTAISRNIEINLLELINDADQPDIVKPVDDILI